MVVETKYLIDPKDIKAVSFTCSNCQSVASVPLKGKEKPEEHAYRCGICGVEWLNGKQTPLEALKALIRGIEEFQREDGKGFKLSFEITGGSVLRE